MRSKPLPPRFRGLYLGRKTRGVNPEINQAGHAPIGFVSTQSSAQAGSEYIRVDQEGHLCTFAPTGSGKGRSVLIPTLLTYPGSCIVFDPKGENYRVTAKARRRLGQQVICLDPFCQAGGSDSLNAFDLFNLPGADIETDGQLMAYNFSDGNRSHKDAFWDVSACGLVSGSIVHVATQFPPEKRTIIGVRDLLFNDDVSYNLAVILDTMGKKMNAFAHQEFSSFLQMPERETRPSVLATAHAYFKAFYSQRVLSSLGQSSFSLHDLMSGKPMTIYIIIPPDKLNSHRSLLRLWMSTLFRTIISRTRIPDLRTLFLIDEAAQLGHFPYLQTIMTLCRGYGVQCWTFWQDIQQIKECYPNGWETLLNNCSVLQTFGCTTHLLARELEYITGIKTENIMRLTSLKDQLLVIKDRGMLQAEKLDYLQDELFKNAYDSNPFYQR